MKTALLILAALALTLAVAEPAAATCVYHEIIGIDPIKRETGDATLDGLYVSVGTYQCHPPPHDEPR